MSDKNNLSFKQICDKKGILIEYDTLTSDVRVSDNRLVKRSNDDPRGYWLNKTMPDYRSSDTLGDTELISSFLERNKITEVTWIHTTVNLGYIEDISLRPYKCLESTTNFGYQCLPPHKYAPWYIWTVPQQQGLAM